MNMPFARDSRHFRSIRWFLAATMSVADSTFDIGIVGLGVMGTNLGHNFVHHDFAVIGHDRNRDNLERFAHGFERAGDSHADRTLDDPP
jgi:UDP-N-acetyl-D-mannosaminuronate dehydrogenase